MSFLSPGSVHLQEQYLQQKTVDKFTTKLFNIGVWADFKPTVAGSGWNKSKAAECANYQDLQSSTIYTDKWSSPWW